MGRGAWLGLGIAFMSQGVLFRWPAMAAGVLMLAGVVVAGLSGGQATIAAPLPPVTGAPPAMAPNFADIFARVAPAVVSLTSDTSLGSGFVIDPAGYVVTNFHVVGESKEVEVRFMNGNRLKSRVVGRDQATDVALLKIDGSKPLPFVQFANERRARVGEWVLAVGNPFGFGGTATAGIISAFGRDQVGSPQFTDYIQVDAAITSGNSGGPTFDMSGRVLGMNTLGFVSPESGQLVAGLGFAIPAATVQRVVKDLRLVGTVERGFVGVQIESLTEDAAKALGLPNANGALVIGVVAGSPAEKAGIRRGDVILKLNGQAIKDNFELSRRIAALEAGQSAIFTIWRNNQTINLTVQVVKRDRVAEAPGAVDPAKVSLSKMTSLGVGLRTITPEIRAVLGLTQEMAGVLITDIDLEGDAALKGLRPGDRIVAVGTKDVASLGDVNLAIEEAKGLKRPMVLLFVVTQAGQKTHVPVKLETP